MLRKEVLVVYTIGVVFTKNSIEFEATAVIRNLNATKRGVAQATFS